MAGNARATGKKYRSKQIDGGFEFNSYYLYGRVNPSVEKSWWSVVDDEYIISFLQGAFPELPTGLCLWSCWPSADNAEARVSPASYKIGLVQILHTERTPQGRCLI